MVFNLLSNALKFTLAGEVEVRLGREGDGASLSVRDTGPGIAPEQIPHVFERFHRIEGTPSRTHEGSGIGLALVRELVKLHGGTVAVVSTPGAGSTFTVRIPLGNSHLPADQIAVTRAPDARAPGESPYVDEALRWLPAEEPPAWPERRPTSFPPQGHPEREPRGPRRARILWADDNADMRAYVLRLLGPRYEVEAVADGEAALDAVLARPPDLVLCDVMMPRLDGFRLLRAIRGDPRTRPIPVILLSARAGEESRVEGLEAGADDYLVKPFDARELLARVGARLEVARVRREAGERTVAVYESISDGLLVLDQGWRCTYVNAAAERMIGRERGHLLGRGLGEEFSLAAASEIEKELREAAADRAPRDYLGGGADGDRWYEYRVVPTQDGGLAVYFRDVTDYRSAVAALRESEERFRRYFELGLIGMAITSPEKGILEVNDEICRIFGLTREEFLRKTWAEMTHPDDLAADLAQFHRVMAGETDGYSLDKRWIRQDGRIIDTTISVKCMRRDDGTVDYFVALLQDVTERKRAEAERERLAVLVENSNDFIGLCDLAGVPTFLNPAALRIVGLDSLEQVRPLTVKEFFFPEDQAFVMEDLLPRLIRDRQAKAEIRFRHFTTGEPIWMSYTCFTIGGPGGEVVALATVSRNVTEERRARLALAGSEARLAAELAVMARLQEVSTRLAKDEESFELLAVVVDAALAITAADMGNIQLINGESDRLRIVAARGFRPEELEIFTLIRSAEGTCGKALERGERVVIEDVATSPTFHGEPIRAALLAAGIRAAQSTPLISRAGRLVGTLATHYRSRRAPTERDLQILDLLARQAADWVERTEAEAALRESEARFRNMADHAPVMVWVADPTGACTYVNERWCRFTGTEPEQGFGFGWLESVHPADREKADAAFRATASNQGAFRLEYRLRHHDGTYRWVIDSAAPRFGPAGEFLGYVGSVLDVSDEKRTEEEIRRARDELETRVRERTVELSGALATLARQERVRKDLLRRVVTVQEDERRRISRELHDQMGQHMTALMLRLRLAKDSVGQGSTVREQLQWLEDLAARISQDVHRIALELRPSALDDLGLPAALANYAEDWSRHSGIAAEVRVSGLETDRLPPLLETSIYRAVQEAMTNVLKHAEASRVVVTLNRMTGYVSVMIEDDGKGFDGDAAMDPGSRPRLGLLGMRERVSFAGGTLAIESSPGAGTSILIRVPIIEAWEEADE